MTKIYTTNEYGEYVERALFRGGSLAGITTALCGEKPEYTDFLGLGVAITDSSCYNLSLMAPEEREKLLKFIYTEEGLNLGLGRLTIGASDYSTRLYTYDDVEGDTELSSFSIEPDREHIIPIVKEILKIRPNLTLFASPWSPPAWMKTGGSLGGGFMRDEFLECYAEYFVKYIKAYEKEGIPIYAVTPQNEPETTQKDNMPACVWHPETEARFIPLLKKKFAEHGLATKIWCYDHSFSGTQRVKWSLKEYPAMKEACDGIAFHYYKGSIDQTTVLKEIYPALSLHFTEGGPRLYDRYDLDWCKWGLMILRALESGYSSFTGWNLMLDETGGPNVGPYFCGGLVTRDYRGGNLTFSGQYKAFRHFSKITPKSKISSLTFLRKEKKMSSYPNHPLEFTEGCLVENETEDLLILANPSKNKEQIQFTHKGNTWYIEMLPDTLATVVLEK